MFVFLSEQTKNTTPHQLRMLNYRKLSEKPTQFLSLTSLTFDEFVVLLASFSDLWQYHMRYFTFAGKPRQRAYSEKKNAKLPETADKLFFLLYYLKNNPLQETLAANFDLDQPQANGYLQLYLPILEASLSAQKVLPIEKVTHLKDYLETRQIKTIYQDGVEREIPRSTDYETQKEYYSGKKKQHNVKNNVITSDTAEVLFVSPTYEGKVHDKKISDELDLTLPVGTTIYQDTGFQGYKPGGEDIKVMMPTKKPRKKEFTEEQKENNRKISSVRVRVEHSIGGIKRIRILKEKIRHQKSEFRERLFLIGCGLHNFRLRFRPWTYQNLQT